MSPRIELLSEEERTCVGITSGPGHEGSVWPQVLGNAELRERYDQHGTQGLDVNFMDASEFFTMLFGSDKFEHLVGELMLAAAARNGGEFTFAQIKQLQVRRLMIAMDIVALPPSRRLHTRLVMCRLSERSGSPSCSKPCSGDGWKATSWASR